MLLKYEITISLDHEPVLQFFHKSFVNKIDYKYKLNIYYVYCFYITNTIVCIMHEYYICITVLLSNPLNFISTEFISPT
jgi:hypothetical protein